MSDQPTTTSETNGAALNGAAPHAADELAPLAKPSGVGRAPKPEDMPRRARKGRAVRSPMRVEVLEAEPAPEPAAEPDADASAVEASGVELELDAVDIVEADTSAIPTSGRKPGERSTRVKFSSTFHPNVYAELIVFCETHEYPIATVLEHALVRFLLLRGVKVQGIWDDPELLELLGVAPAVGAQRR
jgi:hypothetical protein